MRKLAILHVIRENDGSRVVLKNYVDSKLENEYICKNVKSVIIVGNEPCRLHMPMGIDHRFTTLIFPEKNAKLSCSNIEAKVLL